MHILPSTNTQETILAEDHVVIHPTIWERFESYALGRACSASADVAVLWCGQRVYPALRCRYRRHAYSICGIF